MKLVLLGKTWSRRGLRTRIVLLMGVGILVPMAILGWASWRSLQDLSGKLLAERELLAGSITGHVDYVLRADLEILQRVSSAQGVDLEDRDLAPERAALREAYLRSRLLERVILFGRNGEALGEEPARFRGSVPPSHLSVVEEAFQTGRPVVSDLVTDSAGARRLYALVPLRNWRGRVVGIVGGEIDPEGPRFGSLLHSFRLGKSESADLVDGRGVVIASTDSGRLYMTRRRARAEGEMAYAELSIAPWGVSIHQPEAVAFSSVVAFLQRTLWWGPVLLAVALLFALGAAGSVRKPLAVLTEAAERIASGELGRPIPDFGEDEVGRLGRSLEGMRVALKDSLEEVARANQGLERRVAERTRELERLYRELREREEWRGELLRKVISAQEEERKRVARELHDETSQTVAALAMGLETALATLPSGPLRHQLAETKSLAVRTLEELHRVILDLRPSVLDDLGLLSAIRWYAERYLKAAGIAARCEFSGFDRRLPAQMETALFRVVQEAITNITKHAEAETVLIECALGDDALSIAIEDDGKGFDPRSLCAPLAAGRGLGLLGMRERVELLGGTVQIDSTPGQGTRIALTVPVPAGEYGVKDSGSDRG